MIESAKALEILKEQIGDDATVVNRLYNLSKDYGGKRGDEAQFIFDEWSKRLHERASSMPQIMN